MDSLGVHYILFFQIFGIYYNNYWINKESDFGCIRREFLDFFLMLLHDLDLLSKGH